MVYSLAAKVAAEAVGIFFVIYVGESILANELLPKTKGKGMGFGFVALAFGLSFFPPISVFGRISATLNPAVVMTKLVLGEIGAKEFFALTAAQLLGAFLGAVFVWLHYLPHFKTIPEPPSSDTAELLLRSRDAPQPSNLQISSYSTNARRDGPVSALKDLWFYVGQPDRHDLVADDVLGMRNTHDIEGKLRRRSVQVADMHRKLQDEHIAQKFGSLEAVSLALMQQGQGAAPEREGNDASAANGKAAAAAPLSAERERERTRLQKLHQGAIIADQNTKLSIFATRPAVWSPLLNLWAEFMGTTILVTGAELIAKTKLDMDDTARSLFSPALEGLLLGIFVFVIIAGLGGPTGPAINPARDLGPRLAHFLLPIPGKGPSEWSYAWVPAVGGMLGGVAAAGLIHVLDRLKHP